MCMSVIIGDGLQHYTKQNAGNFQTIVTFNSNVKHNKSYDKVKKKNGTKNSPNKVKQAKKLSSK